MGRPSDEGALLFPSYARLPVAFQSAFLYCALYPGVLAALVPSAIERRRFQRLVPALGLDQGVAGQCAGCNVFVGNERKFAPRGFLPCRLHVSDSLKAAMLLPLQKRLSSTLLDS